MNLYLPRAQGAPVERHSSHAMATPEPRLVVADDERAGRLTVTRLKMIGHDVCEALNLVQHSAHVDLVLIAMIMPGGLSGRDVADKATRLKPGIRFRRPGERVCQSAAQALQED